MEMVLFLVDKCTSDLWKIQMTQICQNLSLSYQNTESRNTWTVKISSDQLPFKTCMKTLSKYNKQPNSLCFGVLYKNEIMCIAVIIVP